MIYDEMSQQMNITNPTLNFIQQNSVRSPNDPSIYSVTSNNNQALNENQQQQYQAYLQQQNTFQSSSCGGTYATTSILNSPLSFKNQGIASHQYLATSRQVQPAKSQSKGRQSNSRNGGASQHQSQKSISHQRATSNSNILQTSTNKPKGLKNDLTTTLTAADYKRLSAGSNLSKKNMNSIIQQQQPTASGNMQHQILQLLMSYQSQN